MAITENTSGLTLTGSFTIGQTYTISIIDGRLVHDKETAALFDAGYEIVPRATIEQTVRKGNDEDSQ